MLALNDKIQEYLEQEKTRNSYKKSMNDSVKNTCKCTYWHKCKVSKIKENKVNFVDESVINAIYIK